MVEDGRRFRVALILLVLISFATLALGVADLAVGRVEAGAPAIFGGLVFLALAIWSWLRRG